MLNFLKKDKEKRKIEDYWSEVDSPTVLYPQICSVGSLRAPDAASSELRHWPYYVEVFLDLTSLDPNCSICEDFCYPIRPMILKV